MRARPFVAAVLLPLTVTACVGTGRNRPNSGAQSATLEVNNNFIGAIDLYAVRDNGFVTRIGSAYTSKTQRFRLDPGLIGSAGAIRILAVPVADNGRASTGQITVRPGDVVQFNIAADLRASTVFIR